jgi:hypothetical protein
MGRNAFDYPADTPVVDENGNLTVPWGQWFTRVQSITAAAQRSGTTADRPTKGAWIGFPYYDTTLNKPVYVASITALKVYVWRDAMANIV